MKELMQNPVFFYAISFVVFWFLAIRFGKKPVLQWLDGEIEKISAELTTAHELRAEAEAALADSKAKQARAENEAKVIVEMAKKEAEAMRKQAEINLENTLSRQQHLATERIRMAQENAVEAIRLTAVTMGMDLARRHLTENLSEADATKLVDEAISEIPALKTKRA